MAKTFFLIDGHAQFFRAYYAIRAAMTSPITKEPTNMTYGFVGTMLKLVREYKPDYLAVAIDVSSDTESFRNKIYADYKANREAAPDDFHPQVERCIEIIEEMTIPLYGQPGVEADDVIATIVKKMQRDHPDVDVKIISRDKDLTQLIAPRVQLIDVHKDAPVTTEDVFKVPGVEPSQVGDVLALMGDSSDNIPGVPGIGPKTAAQLIIQYGTLENLMANLDQIKGKRRENLEAYRDQIPMSRQLVQLRDDLEVDFELDSAQWPPTELDVKHMQGLFRDLGFNAFQDSIKNLIDGPETDGVSAAEGGLFAHMDQTQAVEGDYEAIQSVKDLKALIVKIKAKGSMSIDTETDSLAIRDANLCGVSIALDAGAGYYIPTRSPESKTHLDTETVLSHLRPILEDESIQKVGHNLKYDLNILRSHGVELAGPLFDTMVASYVVDATRSSHGMDVLAKAILDRDCIPLSSLIGKGKFQKTFDQVPLEIAVPYAAEDADVALQLMKAFKPQIKKMDLADLFEEIEMPLVWVLAELEYNGIHVNAKELDRQREHLQDLIERLRKKITLAAPHPFNPDSPKQLSAALFNKKTADPPGLELKPIKRGKTGPSTDQEVLERLDSSPDVNTPLPQLVLSYRQLTKLVGTYLVSLKEAISPKTGRVHASFNQTGTSTGRLSSSDPNLQNIPIRTEVGREIRRAFTAPKGRLLLTADYSQIELRILAHLSQDKGLLAAFEAGEDIHRAVAAEVWDVDINDVTPEQRDSAKMVNFGIVYGITPWGLARRLGPDSSVEEASKIIEGYKERFSGITSFLDDCIEQAETKGYVETILKRRRLIPQIHARHPQQRGLGERIAINTVVQGSAADLIKLAMISLEEALPNAFPEALMLLQIHDELVFEVPKLQVEPLRDLVVEHMTTALELDVDLVVDAAWSSTWIDAK